ncbi:hypothetical protein QVD17_40112 [Tagetes erecta]|uniref:Uncharacterized protein n=1 Tax=Tagetes erecta TaxID=13708 RepID=A0AAD8JPN4_TARER|nr:hypothetical protein QVD17_40112 [Tagetes erecta]
MSPFSFSRTTEAPSTQRSKASLGKRRFKRNQGEEYSVVAAAVAEHQSSSESVDARKSEEVITDEPHVWKLPGSGRHMSPNAMLNVRQIPLSLRWLILSGGAGSSFPLKLGPDSPSVDEPCRGTLRFSGHWILTNVCVTQADILASASSTTARRGGGYDYSSYRNIFLSLLFIIHSIPKNQCGFSSRTC